MSGNQRRPGFRLPWSSASDEPETDAPAEGGTPPATDERDGAAEAASSAAEDANAAVTDADSSASADPAVTGAGGEPATAEAAPTEPAASDDVAVAAAAEDGTDAVAPVEEPAGPPATEAPDEATVAAAEPIAVAPDPAATDDAPAAQAPPAAEPEAPAGPTADDSTPDFLRELVTAMRRVADETKQTTVTDLHGQADAEVARRQTETEQRRDDLRTRAEADIAAVGEWAKAEAERIRSEAEQRVAARRSQLEHQLAAETARGEAEAKALRDRVAEYERELDAYHAQLSEINDPAAFAAAAKRMPQAPSLAAIVAPVTASPTPAAAPPTVGGTAATNGSAAANGAAPTNGSTPATAVHPAEEEVLAARLAELDATLPPESGATGSGEGAGAVATATESTTTEVVVHGLGSFGAITGFRQALSNVDGVENVALSLGQSGDFVFRTVHRAGFDVAAAIVTLEGDRAKVEPQPDGVLRVTLERNR